jgi:hypothetical protein
MDRRKGWLRSLVPGDYVIAHGILREVLRITRTGQIYIDSGARWHWSRNERHYNHAGKCKGGALTRAPGLAIRRRPPWDSRTRIGEPRRWGVVGRWTRARYSLLEKAAIEDMRGFEEDRRIAQRAGAK